MYKLLENVTNHKIIGLYAVIIILAVPLIVTIIGYIFTTLVLITAPDAYAEI